MGLAPITLAPAVALDTDRRIEMIDELMLVYGSQEPEVLIKDHLESLHETLCDLPEDLLIDEYREWVEDNEAWQSIKAARQAQPGEKGHLDPDDRQGVIDEIVQEEAETYSLWDKATWWEGLRDAELQTFPDDALQRYYNKVVLGDEEGTA